MIDGIISGLISGFLCSIIVALLGWCYNPYAKSEVCSAMNRLIIYLESMNNDITWGREDEQSDYYDNLIVKVYFSHIYLDNARKATKRLNFITKNRKYILKQYQEIEHGLNTFLTEFGSMSADTDKICRLDNLAKRYQTLTGNVLICRANFVMNLIQFRSLEEALDRSCADDTDESVRKIRAQLSKL